MSLIEFKGMQEVSDQICANATQMTVLQHQIYVQAVTFGYIAFTIGLVLGIVIMWGWGIKREKYGNK